MRKNFKMLVRHGTVYLLKYEIGLFGPDWSSIASFSEGLQARVQAYSAALE